MKRAVLFAALGSFACTEALAPPRPTERDVAEVVVRAPERVPYAPSLLGTGPTPISIVVTNHGAERLDVSRLAVRVEAVRPGLSFVCTDEDDARSSDPSFIEPGRSHTFVRAVNCRLPLAGLYDVAVAVASGNDRSWRLARAYRLEVTAPPELAARLVDDRGVLATIGAARFAGTATKKGHPRIGIALINVSGAPAPLAPLRVETRVRRNDAPWTCTSTGVPLTAPRVLERGRVYRESIDVSCLGFDAAGVYDVDVALLVGPERSFELGQLRFEITEDPAFVLPAPIH